MIDVRLTDPRGFDQVDALNVCADGSSWSSNASMMIAADFFQSASGAVTAARPALMSVTQLPM